MAHPFRVMQSSRAQPAWTNAAWMLYPGSRRFRWVEYVKIEVMRMAKSASSDEF